MDYDGQRKPICRHAPINFFLTRAVPNDKLITNARCFQKSFEQSDKHTDRLKGMTPNKNSLPSFLRGLTQVSCAGAAGLGFCILAV